MNIYDTYVICNLKIYVHTRTCWSVSYMYTVYGGDLKKKNLGEAGLLKGYLIWFVLLPKACLQEERHLETSCYFILSFWTWNKCYQLMTASSCRVKIALSVSTWSWFSLPEDGADLLQEPSRRVVLWWCAGASRCVHAHVRFVSFPQGIGKKLCDGFHFLASS